LLRWGRLQLFCRANKFLKGFVLRPDSLHDIEFGLPTATGEQHARGGEDETKSEPSDEQIHHGGVGSYKLKN
jgi:hypothetical protein